MLYVSPQVQRAVDSSHRKEAASGKILMRKLGGVLSKPARWRSRCNEACVPYPQGKQPAPFFEDTALTNSAPKNCCPEFIVCVYGHFKVQEDAPPPELLYAKHRGIKHSQAFA